MGHEALLIRYGMATVSDNAIARVSAVTRGPALDHLQETMTYKGVHGCKSESRIPSTDSVDYDLVYARYGTTSHGVLSFPSRVRLNRTLVDVDTRSSLVSLVTRAGLTTWAVGVAASAGTHHRKPW